MPARDLERTEYHGVDPVCLRHIFNVLENLLAWNLDFPWNGIPGFHRHREYSCEVCCCGHPVWLPMPALILVGETFGTCSLSLGPGNGVLLCCLSSYRSPVHIESNLYVTFMTKPVFLQYFRKIFSLAQILTDCKNVLELQVVDKYLLGFRWCWCWPGA